MCGILGVSGGRLNLVKPACDLLLHRGPDDSGLFVDPDELVGLGHRRLSIIDLSPSGHQPMVSNDGLVALIFNGEIYNFQDLRADLIKRGVSFRGSSDTEVLLNLYLLDGEEMLKKLNGVFAFAIWDGRLKALMIARDALGVKPLYYSELNGIFAFSSELKALLHLMPDVVHLDVAALHRYLSFLWCPGEGTPLSGVRKMPPGELMWIKKGAIVKRSVWYRLPILSGVAPERMSEAKAIGDTEFFLRQAVHRQLLADVPVGAFLSGGLDSSAIVAFAKEFNPNINCFTIDTPGGQEEGVVEDLPFARKVAKHLSVPLNVVTVNSVKMASDMEFMVRQLDEPIADPAALNVFYISKLARDQGIKVLLSGAGGDDLFTGYRRHRALSIDDYWSKLPMPLRNQISKFAKSLDPKTLFFRRLSKLLNGVHLGIDDRILNYFVWAQEADLLNLYTPEARSQLGNELAINPMKNYLREISAATSSLEKMLALEQRFFLADHNLIYTDKMSMAAGVEVRVPFLDLELVNFAAKVPMQYKQRGRHGKWVLKKAMEAHLPRDVIYRSKSGFGAPLRRWVKGELRDFIGDYLSEDSLRSRGLFNPFAVSAMIKNNSQGKIDASYTILSMVCIEIWCRTYLDR